MKYMSEEPKDPKDILVDEEVIRAQQEEDFREIEKRDTDREKEIRAKVATATRTFSQWQRGLLPKVRFFYDMQQTKNQIGGRVRPKHKDGLVDLLPEDLEVLKLREDQFLLAEKRALRDISDHLKWYGFYNTVCTQKPRFKGIGPTMWGVILSSFDIQNEDTVSKMWSFAGLRPVDCHRCKSCNAVVATTPKNGSPERYTHAKNPKNMKCTLASKELKSEQVFVSRKQMKGVKGEKLKYNSWLRSKLCGVLGSCLLKSNSPWRVYYDREKALWLANGKGMSDGHRHQHAIRKMVKMLLIEIYTEWRKWEKLSVRPPYAVEKLGHKHPELPSAIF